MTLRSILVLGFAALTLNAQASDMAIVEAVTGNMQPGASANTQIKADSVPSSSNRASSQPISKFDYTAREKAREMKCVTSRNPVVEPLNMGSQTLIFSCGDGRELSLHCATGLGCKTQ